MPKTARELTRKEMKGPDRFQVVASEAAAWMAQRQKQLALAAVFVVLIAVVAAGVGSYLQSRRASAGGDLYRALEAASGEVSAVPLPNLDRPLYKTVEEKDAAVLDAARKVRARHPGTRAASTAALLEGDAQLDLKQWDQAIASYQDYLSSAPADDSLRFGALDGLARAQEGKGDLDAAVKTYQKEGEIDSFKDRAALERARVLAKAGRKDEARKALEEIGKDSLLLPEATERLARLGTK